MENSKARRRAQQNVYEAHKCEYIALAEECTDLPSFMSWVHDARTHYVIALIYLLSWVDTLPEPSRNSVAIPPLPQPNEESRNRGLFVGAVVLHSDGTTVGRIVSYSPSGLPIVHWHGGSAAMLEVPYSLTVLRPVPRVRDPNKQAIANGLYIGAKVVLYDGSCEGEIIAWDRVGDPITDKGTGTLRCLPANLVILAPQQVVGRP